MTSILELELDDLVRQAWSLRTEFDLSGIGYGQIHWGNQRDRLDSPFSYYYFLAGLVRLTEARRVLEIGTHQGGSTRALKAGLIEPANSRIVTFDVTNHGTEIFRSDPIVRAYAMDANSEAALTTSERDFEGRSFDLAFIDSTHDFWTTFYSVAAYTTWFRCPLLIIDDITLNSSMARLWQVLRDRFGESNAIDAADVEPDVRTGGDGTRPGFGIVRIAGPTFT